MFRGAYLRQEARNKHCGNGCLTFVPVFFIRETSLRVREVWRWLQQQGALSDALSCDCMHGITDLLSCCITSIVAGITRCRIGILPPTDFQAALGISAGAWKQVLNNVMKSWRHTEASRMSGTGSVQYGMSSSCLSPPLIFKKHFSILTSMKWEQCSCRTYYVCFIWCLNISGSGVQGADTYP